MKKRLVAMCIALSLVLAMSINSFAATGTPGNVTWFGLADIERLVQVANEETVDGKKLGKVTTIPTGSDVKIVNGKRLSAVEWIVRFTSLENPEVDGDYYVFLRQLQPDPYTGKNNEPSLERDTKIYGPDWGYCGIFDWVQRVENGVPVMKKELTGFLIAQRIKRWPLVEDLTFTVGSDIKKVKKLDAKGNPVKDMFGNQVYEYVPLDETKYNKDGRPYTLIASAKAVAASKGITLPNIVGQYDEPCDRKWLEKKLANQANTGITY